ncbi:MAG: hypothetical protein WKF55_01685 [Gemmatimonadaceae bacterium]
MTIHPIRCEFAYVASVTSSSFRANANTVVVAVRDDQIDDALAELVHEPGPTGRGRLAPGTVIVHT